MSMKKMQIMFEVENQDYHVPRLCLTSGIEASVHDWSVQVCELLPVEKNNTDSVLGVFIFCESKCQNLSLVIQSRAYIDLIRMCQW